jgi:hypothetical protein
MDDVVKEVFSAAYSDPEFHDQWMALETWAELIFLCLNLLESNSFAGIRSIEILQRILISKMFLQSTLKSSETGATFPKK